MSSVADSLNIASVIPQQPVVAFERSRLAGCIISPGFSLAPRSMRRVVQRRRAIQASRPWLRPTPFCCESMRPMSSLPIVLFSLNLSWNNILHHCPVLHLFGHMVAFPGTGTESLAEACTALSANQAHLRELASHAGIPYDLLVSRRNLSLPSQTRAWKFLRLRPEKVGKHRPELWDTLYYWAGGKSNIDVLLLRY